MGKPNHVGNKLCHVVEDSLNLGMQMNPGKEH